MQARIDAWVLKHKASGEQWNQSAYERFLRDIGYLVPRGTPFQISPSNVDDELAKRPGPQLVVPADNARYALNAANARWGSLLDAFYGTDAGPPETGGAEKKKSGYNPVRGAKVFQYAHKFLDTHFPLRDGRFDDVTTFEVANKDGPVASLNLVLSSGKKTTLRDDAAFVGFNANGSNVSSVLLRHNGLHVEIAIDRAHSIGKTHPAGVSDIRLEAAVSSIIDFEDSVSAVDAHDKAQVYKNWAGLMRGDLASSFTKGGVTKTRRLNPDKSFVSSANPRGAPILLKGRSLLLVRNVSLHMYTDAVLLDGRPVPEGILDAMVSALGSLHDLSPSKDDAMRNSRHGSVYVVKPKMHGPEEVQFTDRVFGAVEEALGMKPYTIKVGIMDEERRTSVNLSECIRAAKHRCIFINTGFLDRTGDEIHTSFHAGPMLPKAGIKAALWRNAYEDQNVDVGIAVGLPGKGQIGKGMWAAPDAMAKMVATKAAHPKSGATCAWVPSPTAATLHAMHYHQVNVLDVQRTLARGGARSSVSDILVPPLLTRKLSEKEIDYELENNVQGILGYVLRWIQLGVGCSKVPDLENIGLMEDRATLRISSQHVANWLWHGIVSREKVERVFRKMAVVVDKQNGRDSSDPLAMSNGYNNFAYRAALALVFEGRDAPNGLTEPVLHRFRRMEKAAQSGNTRARM